MTCVTHPYLCKINPKNAVSFYFSGQTPACALHADRQDLSQSLPLKVSIRGQGKDGWTKPTHTGDRFEICPQVSIWTARFDAVFGQSLPSKVLIGGLRLPKNVTAFFGIKTVYI
jgi:hypothetical protein